MSRQPRQAQPTLFAWKTNGFALPAAELIYLLHRPNWDLERLDRTPYRPLPFEPCAGFRPEPSRTLNRRPNANLHATDPDRRACLRNSPRAVAQWTCIQYV